MISRAPRIPKIGTFSEPRHLISNPPANPFPSPRGPGFALSRGAVFMSPATSLWTRSPALQACFSRPPASGFSRHARFFLPSRTSADPTDVLFLFYLYIQLDRIKNKCLIRHPCPHSANRKQLCVTLGARQNSEPKKYPFFGTKKGVKLQDSHWRRRGRS